MPRPVFLVGSAPYAPDALFEAAGATLDGLLASVPDGELKGWLPAQDFRRMDGVVEGRGESLSGPPFLTTVRAAEGVAARDLDFSGLHYLPHAVESYGALQAARREGRIDPGVRFQVSIPTPFTGLISWDWDQLRDVWPAYERAVIDQVGRIAEAIPPQELAISWDACEFVMSLANPRAPERYALEELAAGIARCIDAVPAAARTGLHLCYGGYNSTGSPDDPLHRTIADTQLMVDMFHAVRAAAHRPIDWVHMPVPRQREDDAYFAPLEGLRLGPETQLYLGLIYLEDGLEGARRKLDCACRHVHGFGVAAACGLNNPGASSRPRTAEMMEHHRAVAGLE